MNDVENLLESEFGNLMDLAGVDTDTYQSLMGQIRKLPPAQRVKAAQKLMNNTPITLQRGSRYEMEIRFGQLPKEIREGLLKKRLQLVDQRFYVVKEITSKSSIDMLMGTDNKAQGLANIANGKLEKDNWFILTGIKTLYEVADTKESADFDLIPPFIRNGEFELEAGTKKILPPIDAEVFNTKNRADVEIGAYKLENAKMIEPQVEIKMPFKFATGAGSTMCWMRVTFIGSSIIPY
jgi:hypothetical protein